MSRPPRRPPPPRHTVAVEIAGEKHVLRSDVPPEYTRRVAGHVDATIRALPGFQTLEPFRAATLAALSITDELFRARDEIRRLREEADARTHELAERLEDAEAAGAEKRPVRRPAAAASPSPADAPRSPADASRSAADETPPPLPDATLPPPLPDPATPPPLPPQASPPPLAASKAGELHPAWASAPAEKAEPQRSVFEDPDDPELNLPPPDSE